MFFIGLGLRDSFARSLLDKYILYILYLVSSHGWITSAVFGFFHSILHVRGGCTLFVSQWNTDINPNTCDAPDISVMLFRDYVPSKGYTPSKRGNTVKFKNKKKQSLLQWIQTQPEQIIGWLVQLWTWLSKDILSKFYFAI